jgi:hypothetical protein
MAPRDYASSQVVFLAGRNHADLLEEPERVPNLPRLSDLSVFHAMDADRIDPDLVAGWCPGVNSSAAISFFRSLHIGS